MGASESASQLNSQIIEREHRRSSYNPTKSPYMEGGSSNSPISSPVSGPSISRNEIDHGYLDLQYGYEEKIPTSEPPLIPPHLDRILLNTRCVNDCDKSILPEPQHVTINHVYISPTTDGTVQSLGITRRWKEKYITTVFYQPVVTEKCTNIITNNINEDPMFHQHKISNPNVFNESIIHHINVNERIPEYNNNYSNFATSDPVTIPSQQISGPTYHDMSSKF